MGTFISQMRHCAQVLVAATVYSCFAAVFDIFDSCCQLWLLLQAVTSIDCCYKLSTALTAVTSCRQFWQLLQAIASFNSCFKLSPFYSCYELSPALTTVTSCRQLWQLAQTVECQQLIQAFDSFHSSQQVEISQQLSLRKQAVDSFDNLYNLSTPLTAFASCWHSLHHQHIHQHLISILISKRGFLQFNKVVSDWHG